MFVFQKIWRALSLERPVLRLALCLITDELSNVCLNDCELVRSKAPVTQ